MFDLNPATLISRVIVLVIAFTVHEFAHAWTADRFGDPTPRMSGRLTLNPLSHLDPIGSLLLLVAGFGWARPVPVNPYALSRRSSAALMWVSLAGPLSNLLLAVLGAIPLRLGLVSFQGMGSLSFLPTPYMLFTEFVYINLVLMLFNLIPLAPLDGEKIATYFFPPSLARVWDNIRPYGPMILIAVVFIGPYMGLDLLYWIVWRPTMAVFNVLVG
ncbi:MAG: site-2 protease family protein [Chloroflexi bacterium]|jgi:Zn-dependent protease|nr:site-2 protease family protein [Chloroflexota bacterium]